MAKCILIVDDSVSLRQVVKITLTGAGYEVLEAGDGVEALEVLQSHKANLVISDVNMPRMDGLTLLRTLKEKPDLKFMPVIMLTTESEAEKKKQGQEAGARAWVVKPFQPQQMLAAVSKLMM
jgi:two-component system chemotaxis response regulator CheY